MTTGVYIIRNKTTGQVYIGSSIDVEDRWETHKSLLNSKNHHSYKLQNDWDQFGERCFSFHIVRSFDGEHRTLLAWHEKNEFLQHDNIYNLVEAERNDDSTYEILKEYCSREMKINPPPFHVNCADFFGNDEPSGIIGFIYKKLFRQLIDEKKNARQHYLETAIPGLKFRQSGFQEFEFEYPKITHKIPFLEYPKCEISEVIDNPFERNFLQRIAMSSVYSIYMYNLISHRLYCDLKFAGIENDVAEEIALQYIRNSGMFTIYVGNSLGRIGFLGIRMDPNPEKQAYMKPPKLKNNRR